MSMPTEQEELFRAIRRSSRLMRALRAVRDLRLRDAYVGAGAVRDTYWALRHGWDAPKRDGDIDVVFFDTTLSPEADGKIARALESAQPFLRWAVTNQAHVHTW